jgi:hypothetical protein
VYPAGIWTQKFEIKQLMDRQVSQIFENKTLKMQIFLPKGLREQAADIEDVFQNL